MPLDFRLYLSTAIIYRVGGYQGGVDMTEDQGAKDYRNRGVESATFNFC